jgi:hypothetical protein
MSTPLGIHRHYIYVFKSLLSIVFYVSVQEAWKVLTVLKSNSQPIIRKRQLMRTHFGDYRAKMATEEKKLAKSMF